MRPGKNDHVLAVLEGAADRAHLEPFTKARVTPRSKARISAAFNHCREAALDLERFFAHAAADARDRGLHRRLYEAAESASELAGALEDALRSIDAFVETSGTARGALRRVALETRVAVRGRTDALVLREIDDAMLRAIAVYDRALAHLGRVPPGFVDLVLAQRTRLAHLHRDLARPSAPS